MADVGVFPSLPGLAWSVTKAPTFQTRIQRAVSGRELRALDYPFPLWKYTLIYDFLRDNQAAGYNELQTLMGFFMLCHGAFGTFLFQDPTDAATLGQRLGVGDGVTTVFQLQRTLGGFTEPILAPNAVNAVYFNGVPVSSSTYSADPQTGLLSFTSPPGGGVVITVDFTYYFRCRFIDDSYDFENFMAHLWQLRKLTFISVRP